MLSAAHTQLKSGSIVSMVLRIKDVRFNKGAFLKQFFSINGLSLITRPNSLQILTSVGREACTKGQLKRR